MDLTGELFLRVFPRGNLEIQLDFDGCVFRLPNFETTDDRGPGGTPKVDEDFFH